MTAFSDSYQLIQPYQNFKELINKRGSVLLKETEHSYCQLFQTFEAFYLTPNQILKQCNPLLSGKFNRFIDLLESLFEVGYYWKRLTETARLLEVKVPKTPNNQIREASWFIYNLDFYWHAAYGLEERMIRFLKIFKKMYKSPSPEEAKLLELWIVATKMLKTEGTKKVRDPIAHFRSQGVQGWRNDHQWEAGLIRNDATDLIEAYDRSYLSHRQFYLDYVRMWVPQRGKALSIIFDRLCTFPLDRLELE